MLSLYFITTTGYSLTHRFRVIFLVPQYSLSVLLSQQESRDKRLPFFSVARFIFTPPASNERALSALEPPSCWKNVFLRGSAYPPTRLFSNPRSFVSSVSCYTFPAVFQRRFPWLCSVPSGVFLRHASAYTSCHWQRASHPSQILQNGALFKVKSDTFFPCFLLVEHAQTHTHAGSALWLGRKRCLSGCDLLGFSGVWSAANDNWVNLIKTGDLSPSDCFPRRAILRMLKWWRAQRSERMSSYKLHCGHLLSL